MSLKIAFKVENNILKSFVTGERSFDGSIKYWKVLIDKCKQENTSRLLLTIAIRGQLNPIESIEYTQSIIDMLKNTNLIIAIVDQNSLSARNTQIGCNMGASQGLHVSYFDTEKTASAWLSTQYDNFDLIA